MDSATNSPNTSGFTADTIGSEMLSFQNLLLVALAGLALVIWYKRRQNKAVHTMSDLSGCVKRLEPFDRYLACMVDRGSFMLNFSILLRTPRQLTLTVLKEAAWRWVLKNPMLRTNQDARSPYYKDAWFKEIPTWTSDDLPVNEVTSTDWKRVHEEMMAAKDDSKSAPLWGLKLVWNISSDFSEGPVSEPSDATHNPSTSGVGKDFRYALVFNFHHSVTDGTSAVNLMGDFINCLTDTLKQLPIIPTTPSYDKGLMSYITKPSFIESLTIWSMSFRTCLFLITILTRRFFHGRQSTCPRVGVGFRQESSHAVIPILWSEADTAKLMSSCRQRGCTVQGALQAAIGLALVQVARVYKICHDRELDVSFVVPANLRRPLTIPASAIGNYFTLIPMEKSFHDAMATTELWECAKAISQDLRDQLQSGTAYKVFTIGHGPSVLIQRGIEAWDQVASEVAVTGRRFTSVFMSNLGLCRALEDKEPEVTPEALFTTVTMQKVGPVFGLNCTTTNKRMAFTFNYIPEFIEADLANQVVQEFQKTLRMLVESCDNWHPKVEMNLLQSKVLRSTFTWIVRFLLNKSIPQYKFFIVW